jgi:hypothetical protein
MTKVTTSKGLIEEYNSISFNSVNFGNWLIKKKIKYKFHRLGEDLYQFPKEKLYAHTMKELFEMYMKEFNKNYIHK